MKDYIYLASLGALFGVLSVAFAIWADAGQREVLGAVEGVGGLIDDLRSGERQVPSAAWVADLLEVDERQHAAASKLQTLSLRYLRWLSYGHFVVAAVILIAGYSHVRKLRERSQSNDAG